MHKTILLSVVLATSAVAQVPPVLVPPVPGTTPTLWHSISTNASKLLDSALKSRGAQHGITQDRPLTEQERQCAIAMFAKALLAAMGGQTFATPVDIPEATRHLEGLERQWCGGPGGGNRGFELARAMPSPSPGGASPRVADDALAEKLRTLLGRPPTPAEVAFVAAVAAAAAAMHLVPLP